MRKVTSLILIAAISILVIGCGAKEEPAPAPGAAGAPSAGKSGGPAVGGAGDVQKAPGGTDVTPGSNMGKK